MEYKNAAEIMPEELISEIRKYIPCGMLWVPSTEANHKERDELVLRLIENNVPVKEIAALSKLTPRHVRRIVRKHAINRTGADTN